MNTQPDEMGTDEQQASISLALGFEPDSTHYPPHQTPGTNLSPDLSLDISKDRIYQQEQFFQKIFLSDNAHNLPQNIAIIGESGMGKTLFLQKIAHLILEQTDKIPIWIGPHQLRKNKLQEYLWEKWLIQGSNRYRTQDSIPREVWQREFEQLLAHQKVWLLCDGMDYWFDESVDRVASSPLEWLIEQRQDMTDQLPIILTCQTQTWGNKPRLLPKFEVYQTQPLENHHHIKQFIQQWFLPSLLFEQRKPLKEHLDQQLCRILEEPETQHLQRWLKNPQRLALLCRFWLKNPNQFPKTSAQLYQGLVNEFYQWQAENISTTLQQKQQLSHLLAILALKNQSHSETSSIIDYEMIVDSFGENLPLFSLAVQLKWLIPVGMVTENEENNYYTFCDQTFRDYFAALAIDDWQCFLNSHNTTYPIFSYQWQNSFRFWLGREDISTDDKETLIKALMTIDDQCGPANFYGLRAYFIATTGLGEIPNCSYGTQMVEQLLDWGFETTSVPSSSQTVALSLRSLAAKESLHTLYRPLAIAALITLIENSTDEEEQKERLQFLGRLAKGNAVAIAALTQFLTTATSPSLGWQIAETLGTIDSGNAQAIAIFVELLETATTDETRQMAFLGLEKIAQGNLQGIKALIHLLHSQSSPSLRRRTFQALEIIGQGNATAIAILVQLIRTTKEIGIRRQAAESLEKIDPGNPTAITVLVQLLETANNPTIRQEAVYSLGEVCPGNVQAIMALVTLLQQNNDVYLGWIAISSLGKIGEGNEQAIAILENLMHSGESLLLRKEALDSLGKIAPKNSAIMQVSLELMKQVEDEETYREIAESLGKLDPGNPGAINGLTQILQTSRDEFTLRQAAASLGKINPGNLEALRVLVNLIQSTDDADIRGLAAESLGDIGPGNPVAMATLIRLLETSTNLENLRCAAKSLGKVAPGNKEAIAVFVKLLQTVNNSNLGIEIAESLIDILPLKQMPQIVIQLRDSLLKEPDSESSACYKVMWHCAQYLSYREFYQAWHQRALPTPLLSSKNLPKPLIPPVVNSSLTVLEKLGQETEKIPQFNSIKLVWIESSRFIDPGNPAIDIYDQMLEQQCQPFEHGLPENLAKLRLYWHLLQRNSSKTQLILLFYDDAHTPHLSTDFLEILGKFKGVIGVISQQTSSAIPIFSPDDPQLIPTLLEWMTKQVHSPL
ncbi:HEAT repeat domain-containing protein [Crocosphaera sp. UHCC 0190]|uniref:HEAT repeat domain-containing protein n=1 Tax=Crocosphaera sp. UHCC 0190 TaxID=3110246 RepID=UPI002B1FCB90|nr:HEAT repeat domain-containing protein [Crocosphaera sp. UHCC 0190]MEA5510592.1 HEAT repeat domain-containing protein [Crocosphaera sp. UHCC 0190]